eukprot:gene35663-43974_t
MEFLARVCERSQPWSPAARDDANMMNCFDLATKLTDLGEERLSVFVLDLPLILLPESSVEDGYIFLPKVHKLVIFKEVADNNYSTDREVLVKLQQYNPSFGRRMVDKMLIVPPVNVIPPGPDHLGPDPVVTLANQFRAHEEAFTASLIHLKESIGLKK